jgi:hypothetical protein
MGPYYFAFGRIILLLDGKHKLVLSTVFFPLGWKAQACAFQKKGFTS